MPVALGTPATTRKRTSPRLHRHGCRVGGIGRERLAAARLPDRFERVRELGDGRTADLDAGVAPGFHLPRRIAQPLRADAQSGDERDAAVDGERLAMIAREPAQRAVEARTIEPEHVRPRFVEQRPQVARATGAQPVVDRRGRRRPRAPSRRAPRRTRARRRRRRRCSSRTGSNARRRGSPRATRESSPAASCSSRTALPSIGNEPAARANARSVRPGSDRTSAFGRRVQRRPRRRRSTACAPRSNAVPVMFRRCRGDSKPQSSPSASRSATAPAIR